MDNWKRVYVQGKGWRWTDGKGNYKTSNPSFRNPANSAVNAGASAASSAASSAARTASSSANATARAASRTAENERNARSNAIGYAARKREEQEADKPKPKPQTNSSTQNGYTSRFAGARDQNLRSRVQSIKENTDAKIASNKQSNTPNTQSARPAAKPQRSSAPTPKPIPKPATKAPSASETYRDGGKGLYQGTQAYRDKVGGSGNPLLNRFRQDMGRDVASGSKGNSNYNKPEDKGQFVASDGRPFMGPGYGNNSGSDKLRQAMDDQRKKREEERKRLMASRKGTSFGGVS